MANKLMFEVGVKEAGNQLTELENRLKKIVTQYGKLEIKVKVDSLQTFINVLENLGSGKQIEALQKRLDLLQVTLANAGMSGTHSVQEYEAAMKTASAVADQYRRKIEELTTARNKFNENTPRWREANDRLMGFKEDKTTLTIFAQEELAIKNLTEARARLNQETQKSAQQESEALQKVSSEMVSLKGNIESLVSSVSRLVEQFNKINTAEKTTGSAQGGVFDPQKFTTLQEAIDKIISEINRLQQAFTKLGENNSLSNLTQIIRNLEVTMSSLSDRIKLLPVDEQVKMLIEDNERLKQKLIEVGEAARYVNIQAGEKTKQKAENIMGIIGVEPDKVQAVTREAELFYRLLVEIENQMAKIGKIQASGAETVILKNAQNRFEALKKMVEDTISQKPIMDGLAIPMTTQQLSMFIQQFGLLKGEYRDIIKEANQFTKSSESGFNKVETKIADVKNKLDKYNQSLNEAMNLPVSTSSLDAQKQKVDELLNLLNQIKTNKGLTDDGRNMAQVMREYGQYIKYADYEMGKLNKQVRDHQRNAQKDPAVEATKEYASLVRQIANMQKTEMKASAIGVDTTELRNKITLLEQYKVQLEQIINAQGQGYFSFRTPGYLNARAEGGVERQRVDAAYQLEKANQAAAGATSQLTAQEQQLANAMKQGTNEMRNQSQVLSDLKMMAYNYLSVWGAQSFVNKIIETGGLLEQQRLSIAAILGDMEQANELFGQIQQLALKSPFGVVELDRFSKQLTAYGFEYEELYEWTKRLGDISAATGTDVSRLALALGHVRSEGALSGYTLRQFAMANVPVLRMLSENLGISTKQVREKVRKKDISYEDVQKILEQLTDEGGMFYNAQEVMSQALNAKYKNLRDAFDIMYGQIAEGGVGDALKGLAETLTAMAKHWERLGRDIIMVATSFGISRVATMLSNTAIGQHTLATLKNIKAAKLQEQAHLRLSKAAGLLTQAEYKALKSKGAYSAAALKVAIVEKKLTVEELQRAVALGKVDKATAAAAVSQAGYDAKLITSITVLKGWRKAAFLAGEGFRALGRAIWASLSALWPLLALSAVFELFNRAGEQQDKAADAAVEASKATNKYQDLIALNERLKDSEGQKDEKLKEGITQMEEALVAVDRYTEELKKQVDSVGTLAEKYELLRAAMKKVADEGNDKEARKQALLDEAFNVGGGSKWNPQNWFRDNALQDAKDIDDYTQSLFLAFDKNDRVIRNYIEKYMRSDRKWKQEYGAKSAKDLFMAMDDSQRDRILYRMRWGNGTDTDRNAAEAIAKVLYGGETQDVSNISGMSYMGAFEELKKEGPKVAKLFADAFHVDYPEIDLSKANDKQKKIFQEWLRKTLENVKDLKDAGRKAFEDIVIDGTIKLRVNYVVEENLDDVLAKQKKENSLLYGYVYKGGTGGLTTEGAKEKWDEGKRLFGDYSSSNVGDISKGISDKINANKKNIKANKALVASSVASTEAKKEAQKAIQKDEEENKKLYDYLNYTGQKYQPEKTKGGSEDKAAKALRERVRILKEAESAYQYWRKAVGDNASATHVNAEFGETLSKQGYKFEDIRQYKQTLESLKDEYQKIYDASKKAGKYRPQLLEAIKEIDKVLADISRKDFEKDTTSFVSSMTYQIDELTRKWDTFNSVVEATGDRLLAARMSGISPGATPADLKRTNVASFAGVSIDFEKVFKMSEDQIDEYVFKLGVPQEKIKAIQNGLKDWKKAQQDVTKSDIQNYAKWLGSLVDLQSIRNRNQEEYNRILEETNRLLKEGKLTEQEAYNRESAAMNSRMSKDWEATNTYARLYGNSQMMARDEFNAAYAREMENLNKKLMDGTITAADYADKVEKLNQIQREFSTKGFLGMQGGVGAYLSGGWQGLIGYHKGRAKDLRLQGDIEGANREEEAVTSMTKMQNTAEQVTKAFQDLSSGADLLANMFEALGMDGEAAFLGDAAGVLGGAASGASALSGLGPWGMAAGAAIGGITAFAQAHDKANQRVIEALQQDVKALQANTEMLKMFRERTFGYDRGELRRKAGEMYSQYNKTTNVFGTRTFNSEYGAAGVAMAEYYGNGGNGYQQELENLKKERQDYIDMYNEEQDKKDSSNDALLEYKEQIAELDDQILNFTADLANSLWGLDLKGWADQIGDALWTAFENGTDAAEAFHDTVRDLISDVGKRMWKLSVLEPMFKEMQAKLFGEGGAIKYDSNGNIDMQGSQEGVLKVLGEYLGEGGRLEKDAEAGELFYDWVKQITGIDLSVKDNSSSGSTVIKGVNEQQFDLGLAYWNAMRADISVNRAMIKEYFPRFFDAITSSNRSLTNIESHTKAIMTSNEHIEKMFYDFHSMFKGLKNGAWKMPMQ